MRKNYFFRIFLLGIFILGTATMQIHAQAVIASGNCGASGNNLTWQLTDEGVLSINGSGDMADYMTSGVPWYNNRLNITTLTIDNSVTKIGNNAFSGCSSLAGTLIIPNSITKIGNSAFKNCSSLTAFTIGNAVTTIGNDAFSGCSGLTTVNFNATNCTSIGWSCWDNCTALTTLNIGSNVQAIPNDAFSDCSSLTGTLIIPNSVTTIGSNAFSGCGNLTTVNFNATNCTNIGGSCWNNCTALTTLNIGSNVQTIPNYAFSGCSGLTTVNFNATNCTSRGWNCWENCTALTTLNIGSNVQIIPNDAFWDCSSLTGTLIIPNSVTNIGNNAFKNCSSLTALTIGNAVTTIGYDAFFGCSSLTELIIGNLVTTIEGNTFSGCSGLTTVNFNATNCSMMNNCWSDCTLTKLTIGNNVQIIPGYAFFGCSGLTGTLTIPNSVTTIGSNAFQNCSGLTEVIIESPATVIGNNAFQGCPAYTENSQVKPYPLPSASYFYDFAGNGKKGFICPFQNSNTGTPYGLYSFDAVPNTNNFTLGNRLYDRGLYAQFVIDDVNRDGIPDIGLISNEGIRDSLLLSLSDGSYKKIQALLCRNADINADGKIDLFENINFKYNYTLTQQPNGSFLRRFLQTLTFDEYYSSFDPTAWAEANSANQSGKLPPRGGGIRFSGVSLDNSSFVLPPVQRPDVCMDINGDGIPDLLSIETGMVFYGTNDPGKYIITGVGNQIVAKDLNNDGIIDYIIVDAANNKVKTSIYQGNNEYKEQILINEMSVDKNVYCYDFDRDGDVDILVTSSYHKNEMGYFLYSCKNDGKGNFTVSEDAIPGKWAIAGCQDTDNDGFYDVLLADITDENYYSGKEIDIYVRKGKNGFTFNTIEKLYRANENYTNNGTVTTSENMDFGLNAEDVDNDGYMEIWVNGDTYLHKISSSKKNTAPVKPAKPSVIFDAGTGKLQINWTKGSDTQSSACDLTYALRIGTAPDKDDIVYAHANADGQRRNFHEGNAGYNLSKAFDARTWLPGTYYVSLQVIDPQHTGSAWSDEVSFEHNFAASSFTVGKNTLNLSDTLKVFYSEIPGYNYQWTLDGAAKLSSSQPGELHLTWNQGGTKTLAMQIELPDGSLTEKTEETITVLNNRIGFLEPMSGTEYNYNHTLRNIFTGVFADWNMDGKQDVVTFEDGLYKNNGTGKFSKLMKGFNTTFKPYYGMAKWLDWDMDGVADLFYGNYNNSNGAYTYGYLKNDLNDNFTKTDLSLQTDAYDNGGSLSRIFSMADMDNDGDLDPLTLQYRYFEGKQEQGLYKNDGNGVFSFTTQYPFDETAKIADWNKDGFFDLYTPLFKGDYTTNYYYHYSGMQILENKGNYDFEKKVIPFENTITNGVQGNYGKIKFFACDFDNDGYIDLFFFKNERVAHILRNEGNLRFVKGWDILLNENVSLITMSGGAPSKPVFDQNNLDVKIMDLDNNGYPDILFSATDKFEYPQEISDYINHYAPYVIYNDGNGVFRQGFIGNGDGKYLDRFSKNIVTDLNGDGIPDPAFGITSTSMDNSTLYEVLASNMTSQTNTRPQAPTGIVATQTENSLIIEWDDAVDKETPATQMRYNLSVKKKGATGPGSYIISPLNGGNAQMVALSPVQAANYYDENPGHYYIEATRFEIPLSALPLGEVEISVQAIDLWDSMSEFSAIYAKKIENSVKVKTPATTCFDSPVEIAYNGPQGSGQADWNFDGGQIVSGSGWGPYQIKWNTAGVKNISLTIAGETASAQTKVLPDYSAAFGLPDHVFYDTEMEITLPEVAQNATFRWELSNNSSNFLEHWIDARPGNKTGILKITGGGVRYRELTLTVSQNGCEKTYKKGFDVVEKLNPPIISLIYPNASNKNVITWDINNLPANSSEVIIYKEGSYLNDFREIGRVAASQVQFIDISSNTTVKSERYAIAAVLNSGIISSKSEIHQTLHLTINKGMTDGQWNLIWTPYKGREIASYRIMRGTTPESLKLLAEISGMQLSYSDIANASEPYYALEYIPSPQLRSSGLKSANEDNSGRSNVVYSGDARTIVYMNNLNIMCVESNPVLNQDQQSLYLYAEIFPLNTTYQNVIWSIEDGSDLATIDQTGRLKGISNSTGGTVTVKVTAIDGSQTVATRSFTVEAISGGTSIPETPVEEKRNAIVLYPNPVKDVLYIESEAAIKSIIILNSSGVIVKRENSDVTEMNVSALSFGVYFVVVQTETGICQGKFIKR